MTTLMQHARAVSVSSPLGEDVLVLRRMNASEELGRPFRFELDLESDDLDIVHEDLLGRSLTVGLELPGGERRFFDGLVSRFRKTGVRRRRASYQATLRPWLWFLTRTSTCRIFQGLTVPEIVDEVLRGHGITDLDERLTRSYRAWDYCVQYCETDFHFISRLLEQEGIYYFFDHAEGRHSIVLADDSSAHDAAPGYEVVPFRPRPERPADGRPRDGRPRDGRPADAEAVFDWVVTKEVQPGGYTLQDFDFERPRMDLEVRLTDPQPHELGDLTLYDYPGEYVRAAEGETAVRLRLEELAARHERVQGRANCRGLEVGRRFELCEHPCEGENREVLVVAATHHLTVPAFESGVPPDEAPTYLSSFAAMDARTPYRSTRTTPRPSIQGPQTAIVVGPEGEEIWTDSFGRVKVRFHWDRESIGDEQSSCWIRVSQPWAGKGWGGMWVPRIGQEVIVEFLEGDPDRPIITGRVYNGTHAPPFPLPERAAVSGLRSSSTPGNGGYNELSFDDTAGEERVALRAQKDLEIEILNDRSETVGHNRSLAVEADDHRHVKNDRHLRVDNDQYEEIGSDRHLKINGKAAMAIDGTHSLTVGGNVAEVFSKDHSCETRGIDYVKAASIVLEATDGITLKVGGSSVVLNAAGVTVKGAPNVFISGSPIVNINSGSGPPPLDGPSIHAVSPAPPRELTADTTPHQPDPTATGWVEIELVDEEDNPVPGERYEVTLPDGSSATGTLDEHGFARVEGFDPGSCQVTFPDLDQDVWEPE